MIQRIQSVYLLLTALLSSLFLKGNILTLKKDADTTLIMNIRQTYQLTETGTTGLIRNQSPAFIILGAVILLSIIAIFFYRKRKLQMKMAGLLILLTLLFTALLIFYAVLIISEYKAIPIIGFKMFIPFLMILSGILAYRGIRKDEEIVKSYDRLR